MVHGRAAVVLEALTAHGDPEAAAERLESRLRKELDAALRGEPVPGLPTETAGLAGTLALASLAGVDYRDALVELARDAASFEGAAWHAAQVAVVLGGDTPDALWRLCVDDLGVHPWAPWIARAARKRGDARVLARTVRDLLRSLGGLNLDGTTADHEAPAVAAVAVSMEALAEEESDEARARLGAGRAYLRRWQFAEPWPPGVEPEVCRGAFPLSPSVWTLRADVTGHALLAMLAR
jgi:hypothetical protein